jgi:hypothetical protein
MEVMIIIAASTGARGRSMSSSRVGRFVWGGNHCRVIGRLLSPCGLKVQVKFART